MAAAQCSPAALILLLQQHHHPLAEVCAGQVCAFIGLCDSQGQAAGASGAASRKLRMASSAAQTSTLQLSQGESGKVGDSPMCPFCTTAVAYIKVRLLLWAPFYCVPVAFPDHLPWAAWPCQPATVHKKRMDHCGSACHSKRRLRRAPASTITVLSANTRLRTQSSV